jgi:hypothetical protein
LADQHADHSGFQAIAVVQRPRHVSVECAFDFGAVGGAILHLRIHMLDRLLENDIDFGTALMPVRSSPQISQVRVLQADCRCSVLPFALLTQCCLILASLRRGLAEILAMFGGRLFQEERAYQFQQREHAAYQQCDFTRNALLRTQALEFAFQTVEFFTNRGGINAGHVVAIQLRR